MNRAMCGVLFLFSLATGLNATRFPSPESCTIVNQSTSGPSGRPDLQFVRNGKLCCLVEVKTRRFCLSDGKDVLNMDGPVYFLYGDRGYNEDALNNLTLSREKKEITILYRVCWFSRKICLTNNSQISRYGIKYSLDAANIQLLQMKNTFSWPSGEAIHSAYRKNTIFLIHQPPFLISVSSLPTLSMPGMPF